MDRCHSHGIGPTEPKVAILNSSVVNPEAEFEES